MNKSPEESMIHNKIDKAIECADIINKINKTPEYDYVEVIDTHSMLFILKESEHTVELLSTLDDKDKTIFILNSIIDEVVKEVVDFYKGKIPEDKLRDFIFEDRENVINNLA